MAITFGTDGWRAVIADGYTFENLTWITRATAQWLQKARGASSTVVVGHDTRFLGRAFAERVAQVLAAEGMHVLFADTFAPTPAISWATKAYGADLGIVITASHNPPEYNGFKLKSHLGGTAPPDQIAEVEAELPNVPAGDLVLHSFDACCTAGQVEVRPIRRAYIDMLAERLDVESIRQAGVKIAHDAMFGSGQGVVAALLGSEHVVELRSEMNPGFQGQAPEPIERNLAGLSDAVVREGCAAGLANDGDADRIGMIDEAGRFVSSHQILALLAKYLHTERGLDGTIVKTFSTTHMLDRMGKAYNLPVETTPIGFKYIVSKIIEDDVLVGGEESGGIAVKDYLPERDGLFIGMLIVEMMVRRGKALSALVQELFDEFGPHHYYRVDVHTTPEKKARVLDRLQHQGGLDTVAGHAVARVDTLDGYKHITAAGWLLVRPSGTEPVLRIYAEAETPEGARALVEDGLEQLGVSETV